MSQEKYQPTPEEIKKAEEMMDPMMSEMSEHREDRLVTGGIDAENWKYQLKDFDDSQELAFTVISHQGPDASYHKITAGDLKKQLSEAEKSGKILSEGNHQLLVNFKDGGGIDLSYHDYYYIRKLTDEDRKYGIDPEEVRQNQESEGDARLRSK